MITNSTSIYARRSSATFKQISSAVHRTTIGSQCKSSPFVIQFDRKFSSVTQSGEMLKRGLDPVIPAVADSKPTSRDDVLSLPAVRGRVLKLLAQPHLMDQAVKFAFDRFAAKNATGYTIGEETSKESNLPEGLTLDEVILVLSDLAVAEELPAEFLRDRTQLKSLFSKYDEQVCGVISPEAFRQLFQFLLCAVRDEYFPPQLRFRREFFITKRRAKLEEIYEIQHKLGQGQFGAVYRVKERGSGNVRCCKVIAKALSSVSVEQASNELNVLRLLDHQNIMRVFECFEDRVNIYIICELLEGYDLQELLLDHVEKFGHGLEEKIVRRFLHVLLSALAHCHANRVMHKDLKPANVMIVPSPHDKMVIAKAEQDARERIKMKRANERAALGGPPPPPGSREFRAQMSADAAEIKQVSMRSVNLATARAKIVDFGLAEIFSPGSQSNAFGGTPYYMAPEVFAGEFNYKCDVWSTGVLLYVLLSGYLPFSAKSSEEFKKVVLSQEVSFPPELFAHVSPDAIRVTKRMLQKDTSLRPTAADLLTDPWITGRLEETSSSANNLNLSNTNDIYNNSNLNHTGVHHKYPVESLSTSIAKDFVNNMPNKASEEDKFDDFSHVIVDSIETRELVDSSGSKREYLLSPNSDLPVSMSILDPFSPFAESSSDASSTALDAFSDPPSHLHLSNPFKSSSAGIVNKQKDLSNKLSKNHEEAVSLDDMLRARLFKIKSDSDAKIPVEIPNSTDVKPLIIRKKDKTEVIDLDAKDFEKNEEIWSCPSLDVSSLVKNSRPRTFLSDSDFPLCQNGSELLFADPLSNFALPNEGEGDDTMLLTQHLIASQMGTQSTVVEAEADKEAKKRRRAWRFVQYSRKSELVRALLNCVAMQFEGNSPSAQRALNIFRALDVNNDGELSVGELLYGLEHFGVPRAQCGPVAAALDVMGTGVVTCTQWLASLLHYDMEGLQAALFGAFRQLDIDDDGIISKEDLETLTSAEGGGLGGLTADEALALMDLDANGGVDFTEFKHFMEKVAFASDV